MPTPPFSNASRSSLEEEIRALRAENKALRAAAVRADAAADHQLHQARFRTVFEHSPLGMKIIGADLGIQDANTAVATLLGLDSPVEVLGHSILEYAHPDDWTHWRRLQQELWTHRRPWFALETRLLQPDGSHRWCRVTSVLLPGENGDLGYTSLEDISERRALEAQAAEKVREAQEANQELASYNEELHAANEELQETNALLARANAELDTFVYAASHDLRTPLTNLQGLLNALREHLPAPDGAAEPIAPLLGMMQVSLVRLLHALNRLADFGAVHQDRVGQREQVVLAAVLEQVRQDVLPLLAASAGRLDVELTGDPALWFPAKHVHTVVLNLVSNALQYAHPDRPPVVRVEGHRDASRLVVRVHDNGLGLSESQQGQLFRMFRRFHPQVEGTGVGLYLVKKILDNAGGTIRVDSQLGQGTTFTVVFAT
ncbi:sensor histidine kinase [Hymenobacter arizonensis]|nr:PAS domain-containing sensor histidine kinase [Hymenobacter arizonensis]